MHYARNQSQRIIWFSLYDIQEKAKLQADGMGQATTDLGVEVTFNHKVTAQGKFGGWWNNSVSCLRWLLRESIRVLKFTKGHIKKNVILPYANCILK